VQSICTNLQAPHVLELRHDCSAPSSKLSPMMPTRRTARSTLSAAAAKHTVTDASHTSARSLRNCEVPWQEVRWPRDVELRKVLIYEKTSRLISLARLQPACTASHFRSTFHIEVAGGISHLKRGVAGTCT